MVQARMDVRRRAVVFALSTLMVVSVMTAIGVRPAGADVTAVKGSAFGYYANVSLFGGPLNLRGFGQVVCTAPNVPVGCAPAATAPASASPSVVLPTTGGNVSQTDADGVTAQYGPATIFGGIQLPANGTPPPSGPITVASQGTTGPTGSVTSSVDITLYSPATPLTPGGVGPTTFAADGVHSTCTVSPSGTTASTTIVNGLLALKTDLTQGEPLTQLSIPANPPPNYTVAGEITNVGDRYRDVFNEQVKNPDGSITVNAYHEYLLGPTAVGDLVVASSTCGATGAPGFVDTQAPTCVVTATLNGPPATQDIVIQDSGSGLTSINNIQITNGTVGAPSGGPQSPVTITATQTNANVPTPWSFDTTDVAGHVKHCTGKINRKGEPQADFDGRRDTDVSVFRPSTGAWYVEGGLTTNWGTTGDVAVPADYTDTGTAAGTAAVAAAVSTGDGITDVAVFRPSTSAWYVKGGVSTTFGTTGDIPVPGDYNGDGTTDIARFRPSTGQWFIQGGPTVLWGTSGDVPVPGDYNRDGTTDIAVYRAGAWYIRLGVGNVATGFGVPTDVPLPLPAAVDRAFF